MEHKVNIQDIARLAGVSKSTVSRYLNQGYVSQEKSDKIKAIIEKTGFKSNFFAKRLKTKRSKLIGVVLPRMDSVTVGKLLSGISRLLEPLGYQGLILTSRLDTDRELSNIESLSRQGVDGIIVDSIGITERHLKMQDEVNIPILYTGQKNDQVNFLKVDDYAAGRLMGAYLKDMGHKKAVFAGVTETDIAVGQERKHGFMDAFLADNDGAQVYFVETGFDFLSSYNKAEDIYKLKPTVVVGATDNIGLGILRYFHEKGIKVPEEISVTGFGGYDVGAVVYPALTTVSFDYELVGMKTAQYMVDLIEGRENQSNNDLPVFFMARESVKKLN